MSILSILPFTRSLLQETVQPGDIVVDATMGNGLDTLFLASLVGPTGTVFAYDIQEEALNKTRERLKHANSLEQVQLLLKGHQTVEDELSSLGGSPLTAASFNLGYRPGGNKEVVTHPTTTIEALHKLSSYLKKGGLITVVVYSGHEQGTLEKEALLQELEQWNQDEYQILQYQFINQKNDPPFLLAIKKKV